MLGKRTKRGGSGSVCSGSQIPFPQPRERTCKDKEKQLMRKTFKKLIASCLAGIMSLSVVPAVPAKEVQAASRNTTLTDHVVVGFWHNFDNGLAPMVKLADTPEYYDIINVSFAESTSVPGQVTFNLAAGDFSSVGGYSVEEFKNDIASCHQKGQKVLLSCGGEKGTISVTNAAAAEAFKTSLIAVTEEYGFDGVDIDFEGGAVSSSMADLSSALKAVADHFGNDYIITLAPETVYIEKSSDPYGKLALALGDYLTICYPQLYNTGGAMMPSGMWMGSARAGLGLVIGDDMKRIGLRDDQIGFGYPAMTGAAGSGVVSNDVIADTVNKFVYGGTADGYTCEGGNPNFRAVMTWSVNWDKKNDYKWAKAMSTLMASLPGTSGHVPNGDPTPTPNAVVTPTTNPGQPTPTSGPSYDYPEWESGKAYSGGDRVVYQGNAYEARWWTQGDTPADHCSDGQPWKLIGSAGPTTAPTTAPTVAPTTPPTNTPTPTTSVDPDKKNGWKKEGSKWYYYVNDVLQKGLFTDTDGKMYYLDNSTGAMFVTGWKKVDGDWYYFKSGVAKKGWFKYSSDGKWYYFDAVTCKMLTGIQNIDGTNYILLSDGSLPLSKWAQFDGKWYHTDSKGAVQTNKWSKSGGKWYYLGADGVMVTNCRIYIDGMYYTFDANGAMTKEEAATVTPTPSQQNTELAKHLMIGYWQGWDNTQARFIPLNQVDDDWDVINISFAEPVTPGSTNGKMKFEISGLSSSYTINDFKQDVKDLQARGKKVVLAIGGYEGYFSLKDDAGVNQFVSDIKGIVDEYGFDGIDIDLEQTSVQLLSTDNDINNPTSPNVICFNRAIRTICESYGKDFILSWAPETWYMQKGYQYYAGSSKWGAPDQRCGSYIPMIHNLRDITTFVQVQLYNSGQIMGLDGGQYGMGNKESIIAMCEMLLQGFEVGGGGTSSNPAGFFTALRPDQVVIGLPASTGAANSGQVSNADIQSAFTTLNNKYPGLRGIMSWSINWDNSINNNGFVNSNGAFLDGLND